jgi:hypothetical protein
MQINIMLIDTNWILKLQIIWMLDPGLRDCAHSIEYSRIRDRACPIPYIYCNYSHASGTSRNRRKLTE